MNAIVVKQFGDPEVLTEQEVDRPEAGSGEYLVKLNAVGINPVETYVRSGNYAKLPELPYTPGTDGAGVIEACGSGAEKFAVGERVYLSGSRTGTYAEYAVGSEGDVHKLPGGVSFAQGAAIGIPYATAIRAVKQRGRAQSGETILIHGATGGVGLACVQYAKSLGLRVLGTGGSDDGRKLVLANGADEVFDHHDEDYCDRIVAVADGVDLIIEMLANENLASDLKMIGKGGRIVIVGSRGPIEINPRGLMVNDVDVRGMVLPNASDDERAEFDRVIGSGLSDRSLRPVIGRKFLLGDAVDAHREIMNSSAGGKMILSPCAHA
ncbi:MAG: NADPH:quinone reductase [Chthoniobacterales bacterium]